MEIHTDVPPVILSVYGVNFEKRMLEKILYVVINSDVPL
jgi:hypothetical protein